MSAFVSSAHDRQLELADLLRELVDLLGYPCTNTLMGLGAYPATNEKFLVVIKNLCDAPAICGRNLSTYVAGPKKH